MQAHPPVATVQVQTDRTLNVFRPASLGAGLDGLDAGGVRQVYTRRNLRLMRQTGLGAVSYRLRTELGVEAWHWNPRGRWSDPRRRQGYWTSSATPSGRPRVTFGYRLPRRGDSIDQANDDGYSRLDDGSLATFWKSDPYLDPRFTREPERLHRQWIMLAFRQPAPIDAIRLRWAAPYAKHVRAEYWVGRTPIYFYDHPGHWAPFPRAQFRGHAGLQTFRVAASPRRVRFIRLVLSGSSHTGLPGSRDTRDRLGFAAREIYAGSLRGGRLADLVRHLPHGYRQTEVYVSSTDPWHRASDLDPHTEQPSFQTVARSGLPGSSPLMIPAPVLYANPTDAVAELRYLRALGIRVGRVELGEEPDGQLASPEDYGVLYAQAARALRRYDPHVQLGGPGYQTAVPDWKAWADPRGDTSWTRRFLAELSRRRQSSALSFFSFEWYPFDNGCAPPASQLERQPALLAATLASQARDGLPASIPKVISEYGWSAFANRAEVSLAGALMDADIAGTFLADGGQTAYLYGYEPATLLQELPRCQSWGNLALLQSNDAGQVIHPLATWWGMRMLTQDWLEPGGGLHALRPVAIGGVDPAAALAAYAVTRPDGRQAVLLLNKDPSRPVDVRLAGIGAPGPLQVWQLSSRQYVWRARGERGYPRPDAPPARFTANAGAPLVLPPDSLTVART